MIKVCQIDSYINVNEYSKNMELCWVYRRVILRWEKLRFLKMKNKDLCALVKAVAPPIIDWFENIFVF